MKVNFILGEDKRIRLLIRSPNNEPFTVSEASYKLTLRGKTEAEELCEIDGHYLDIKLAPKTMNCYVLEVEYKVSDCIRKARVWVEVV